MFIDDSYFLKCRIECALDEDGFFEHTTKQKISDLKYLKNWVTNALKNSMYPQEETKKLKDLRSNIDAHLIALKKRPCAGKN
jgi:hypothetical protein